MLEVSRATAKGLAAPAWQGPRAALEAAPAATAASPAVSKRQPAAARDERKVDRKSDKQQRAQQAQRTRPLRIELQQLETRLARLSSEKAEVDTALAADAVRPDDFAELGRKLAHIAAETHQLEERWLALHATLDELAKAG